MRAESLEPRRMLAGIFGDFDPLGALPDPLVDLAVINLQKAVTDTQKTELNDSLTIETGIGAIGPIRIPLDANVVWAAYPGGLNFNFSDSWFGGSVEENITTLGLASLGLPAAAITHIDVFHGKVTGPDGSIIKEFTKRAPGIEYFNVGNTPGTYEATVEAKDFAGHVSKKTMEFTIVDADPIPPDIVEDALVGFNPDGKTIDLPDDQDMLFEWVVEDEESGLDDVEAELGGLSLTGTYDAVDKGQRYRNRGSISTEHLPFGTHTLTLSATDADQDFPGDQATSTVKQKIRFFDDDDSGPTIALSGPSGTADDESNLVFGWSISDVSGLHSYSVNVTDNQGNRLNGSNPSASGSFDFNAYPPGRYTIAVNATDNDFDRGRASDRSSSSASRTVLVTDSDRHAPVIRFTTGSGDTLLGTSYSESHGVSNAIVWNVTDQSGVHPIEARLFRDETLVRSFEGPANKVELLDSDGLGTFRLELTATEQDDNQWSGDQQVTVASATLTVTNAPPTVFAGGPYVVTEGQPIQVAAVGSDPDPGDTEKLTYSWDLDGDGVFGDVVGQKPTIPWSALATAGIADDGSYAIHAQAADIFGETATSSATITVLNAPPQVESISADPFIDENTTITATGLFSDPSPLDTHDVVVFWGDGTSSAAVVNHADRTFTATHHYADDRPSDTEFDDYVLRVEVIDDEGAVNPQRSRTMSVETTSVGAIELPSFPLSLPEGVSGRLEAASVLVDPQSASLETSPGQAFNHQHYYDYPSRGPFNLSGAWTSSTSAGGSHTHSLNIPSQTKTFTSSSDLNAFRNGSRTYSMTPVEADGLIPSNGLPEGYEHEHKLGTPFNTTTKFTYYPSSWQTVVHTNFSSFPSNARLTGSAHRAGRPYRLVTLTRPDKHQKGSIIFDSVGSPVKEFWANFDMWVGRGSGADGMSFGLGKLSNSSRFGETGVSEGLFVGFDTYGDNQGVNVYYNGKTVKHWSFSKSRFRKEHWDYTRVSITSSGDLTVYHPHTGYLGVRVPNWNPKSDWRFGLGARTGASTDWHEIDDLRILAKYDKTQTITRSHTDKYELPRFTASGSLKKAVVTLDSPSFNLTATDGGQFLHGHDVDLNVGPFSFAGPTSHVSALNTHAHAVDFDSQQLEFNSEADLATYFLQEENLKLTQGEVQSSTDLGHSHTLAADTVPFTTITQFTYDVASAVVRVKNVDPRFTTLTLPTSTVENSTVELSGSIEDRGLGDTHEVHVNWADGTEDTIALPPGQYSFAITHLFDDDNPTDSTEDVYPVRVTVRDDDGGETVTELSLTVLNENPALTLGTPVEVYEGATFPLPQAIFTDRGRQDTHTLTTDWGDHQSSDAAISQGPGTGVGSDQHIYRDDGDYPVTVTLRDDDRGESQQSFTARILNAAPVITTLKAGGPALEGAGMKLIAEAVDAGVDDVLTYTWDFGDESSTVSGNDLKQVEHVYANEGTYTATLTVDDNDGGVTNRSLTFVVPDLSNGVTIAGAADINEGQAYALTLTTLSAQAASAIDSWTVDWGDGTSPQTFTSEGVKTYTYTDGDASHTIRVSINKSAGGTTDVGSLPVTVHNTAPVITGLTGDVTGLEGGAFAFSATAADAGNDQLTYAWDFGDGSSGQSGVDLANVNHTFADDGARIVQLTVTDGDGGTATAQLPVIVSNVAPTIVLSGDVSATEGSLYKLTLGSVADPGSDTVSQWLVDWGDGSLNTYDADGVVSHAYPDGPDGHTISVSLVDEDGTHAAAGQLPVTVVNAPPEIHSITGKTSGKESERFQLTADVSDPAGPFDTLTYRWDFGDGSPVVEGINLVNVQHEYVDNGTYTVGLTVTDEDLQSDSSSVQIVVENITPTTVLAGAPVTFEGSVYEIRFAPALDPGQDTITQWIVNWGDGTSDTLTDPKLATHTYADGQSSLEISVTLVDEDGSHARAGVFPLTVKNVAPEIQTLTGPSTASEGTAISLNASASDPARDQDPLVYHWDFGDGSAAESGVGLTSVDHVFADDGLYTVTVSVDDGDGGTDSQAMQVLVENVAPTIALPSETSVEEGASFELVLGAISDPGADTVTQWLVDWGDGDSAVYTEAGTVRHQYDDGHNDYLIRVDVVDEDGVFLNAGTHPVRVDNADPLITGLPADTTSEEGSLAEFQASAVDPAGSHDTLTYTWDFGDGTDPVSSALDSVEHAFGDNGTYTVTLTVDDEDGGSASSTFDHVVTNVAPTIALGGTGASNEASPYVLTLGDIGDPGDDTVTQWIVDWGDGTSNTYGSNGAVEHTYGDGPRQHTIAVSVVDEDGTFVAGSQVVNVANVSPTVNTLTGSLHGYEGDTLQFLGTASDPAGALDTLTYVWDLGDGSDPVGIVDFQQVEAAYGDDGTFELALAVRDEDGGSASKTLQITIENVAPQFEAGVDDLLRPPVQGSFSRTDIPFTDPGLDEWSGTVDYGDGTVKPLTVDQEAKTLDLSHVYTSSGTFTVEVTLEDDEGAKHTDGFSVEVILAEVEFAAAAYSALEDGGTSQVVQLKRTPAGTNVTSQVKVEVTGGSAQAGSDYGDTFPLTITFDPGVDAMSVPVALLADATVELDETVDLKVTSVSNAVILAQDTSTLTITNDDAATLSLDEVAGDEDSKPLTFTASLSNPVDVPVNVRVDSGDGTALLADDDYVAVSNLVLAFAAGDTTRTFDVTLKADTKVEPDETLKLGMSSLAAGGRAVNLGSGGTGTILNDDHLAGRVFDDRDNDGVFDAADGDQGLSGVTLELRDESDGSLVATRTTDASGDYVFDLTIPAGNYRIDQQFDDASTQPVETSLDAIGMLDGIETAGVNGGVVVNSQDSDSISQILIGQTGAAAAHLSYDFAELVPASLQGLVWEDFDDGGDVDLGELAIDNVGTMLRGTDDRGASVERDQLTDTAGIFEYVNLRPGTYQIIAKQPTGIAGETLSFVDGREVTGEVLELEPPTPPTVLGADGSADADQVDSDGSIVASSFSGIELVAGAMGLNYNFGERIDGGTPQKGQAASIGFWQNKQGRALIEGLNGGAESTLLAGWLSSTFPNMYGELGDANSDGVGDDPVTNREVADLYRHVFKKKASFAKSQKTKKLDAHVMAVALSTYVTKESFVGIHYSTGNYDSTLVDHVRDFKFTVTTGGLGSTYIDVGDSGEAFGVADDSEVQIIDLLLATDEMSKDALLYDVSGDGEIDDSESLLRVLALDVYKRITGKEF